MQLTQHWPWIRWAGLTVLVLGIAIGYWRIPVAVDGISISTGTVVAEVMGTGTLEARVSATISPKIAGRIINVLVDQGDRVQHEQLLFKLDDEELQQQVAIAEANVQTAKAALQRLVADKARTVAVFQQAERHQTRIETLMQTNAATQDDLERAMEGLAVATADVARAEAAILEGEKGLQAAEKSLEYQRARLADTIVRAPFAGLIVARLRESGDITVPGSPVLTLISTDELWIRAWIDETQMSRLAVDQSARIVFRSEPETSFPGRVSRLGKQTDRETREFVVDVRASELPVNWAVGQRAEVFIETDRRDQALALPRHLTMTRDSEEGVWVAKDGIATWRDLELGLRGTKTVEVIAGLDPEDIVLQLPEGSTSLEGRRVRLK